MFLLNPEGKLQAIFEPEENEMGIQIFRAERIYRDYLEVLHYHDKFMVAAVSPSNTVAMTGAK